jgi:hypothetical protein
MPKGPRPSTIRPLLTVGETEVLLALVYARYERGLEESRKVRRTKLKALEQLGYCEENPTSRGHWRITERGLNYFW